MSVIAAAVKHLLAAGLEPARIVAAVAEMEAAQPVDPSAERRRAKDRERKRIARAGGARTSADTGPGVSPSPLPPGPPNPAPPSGRETPRTREQAFAAFWEAYPRKVGKPKALAAYDRALKGIGGPDPPGVVLAGLRAQLPGWAARAPNLVPHPTTWLNREGWNDQPDDFRNPRAARGGVHVERAGHDAKSAARRAGHEQDFAGSEIAADRWRRANGGA